MNNRQQRDVERLSGRRGDTTQRAILWSELETLAQKLSGMLRTQKAAKAIADQLDEGDLRERAINRSDAIREVNQLIDTTNEFIANEAARLDASDQAIIDVNIAAVEARLGDAEVAVQDEIIARTDGDTALGQQITTVEADLAAAEASVTQNASAIATIEGFQAATYSLRVDAGDASGSLELVAADDPVNGPASAVRIRADNILLDGTVLAHHIDVASLTADAGFIGSLYVDTLNIAGNAATVGSFSDLQSQIVGDGTEKFVVSSVISVPANSTADIFIAASFSHGYPSGTRNWGFSLAGGPIGSLTNLASRSNMTFGNDYPVVTYIATYTNTGSSAQDYLVWVYWTGEDSGIILNSDETTLSLVARWR